MDRKRRGHEAWRVLRIQSELVDGIDNLAGIGASVTIFGSARFSPQSPHYANARELARRFGDSGLNVLTGGGPGVMEAANRGAFHTEMASVGLNIELPQEQGANSYQDRELHFRYFFVRKLMFVKHAVAFVVFPGGFGTMDELFEALTLVQTGKIQPFPIVLFGSQYWAGLLEWMREKMLAEGCIDATDIGLCQVTDSVDEAHEIVMRSWKKVPAGRTDNLPSDV